MTARGLIAFVSYIVRIYSRWARVTVVRYGVRAVVDPSYRPRRRGVGRGRRNNPYRRAHGLHLGTDVQTVLARIQAERMIPA